MWVLTVPSLWKAAGQLHERNPRFISVQCEPEPMRTHSRNRMTREVALSIEARSIDLPGDLHVKRALLRSKCREVGPFVYLDHLGPTPRVNGGDFKTPPHPHAGLSTLTYLYSGAVPVGDRRAKPFGLVRGRTVARQTHDLGHFCVVFARRRPPGNGRLQDGSVRIGGHTGLLRRKRR